MAQPILIATEQPSSRSGVSVGTLIGYGLAAAAVYVLATRFDAVAYIEGLFYGFPQTESEAKASLKALHALLIRARNEGNTTLQAFINDRINAILAKYPSLASTSQSASSSPGTQTPSGGGPVPSGLTRSQAITLLKAIDSEFIAYQRLHPGATVSNNSVLAMLHKAAVALRAKYPQYGLPAAGYTPAQLGF